MSLAGSASRKTRAWTGGAVGRWLLLAALVGAGVASFWYHPDLFRVMTVAHYQYWFIDTYALLASSDAAALGLNPSWPNPLDYFHRPHVYSSIWLKIGHLGLTRADVLWVGGLLVLTFLLVTLYRLRPRSGLEVAGYAALYLSAPFLLAMERANNDLVVVVLLAGVVPCLRSRSPLLRLLAPALIAVAASLKYYPAAAGLVLIGVGSQRDVRERIGYFAALLVLIGVAVWPDLRAFGRLAPEPQGLLSFGSASFWAVFGVEGPTPKLLGGAVAALVVLIAWRRRPLREWQPSSEIESDWLHFVMGAVLLAGCFFTSMNFGYRWVFALWLAPLLWRLAAEPSVTAAHRMARKARWLLLGVLWWDACWGMLITYFRGAVPMGEYYFWTRGILITRQPLDWALMLMLLVFLTQFVQQNLPRAVWKERGCAALSRETGAMVEPRGRG